ncbi:hypothetical protein GGH99_005179 [Coemansia sp. RSA 1285]|nr:hypothetical protein GGH99_005179 [Coemansia sp. RSA 1285]
MSDSGYFFADAFGLVRPTVSGIKGLDGVDGISTNTLLPEVLSALVRSNAGYPADPKKECTVPRRFGVMPPQSLQKEVFPWIKHLLIGAFEQNNNNDDVRSATRLLRVLRELRIVLLQDVAFLMEMPYLRKVIEDSVFFKHDLFASPDFQEFRQEMRAAVAKTEIRDMETMCTAAVNWVKDRRIEAPDGSIERMIPTAPRLLNPETYSVSAQDPKIGDLNQHTGSNIEALSRISNSQRPSDASSLPGSHAVDEERKRQLDAAAAEGGDSFGEAYDSERQTKRSRRVYEMALTGGTPYRIYGDATAAGTQMGQPGSRPFVINSSDNVAEALNSLRMENDDLKSHVRKLEWVLNQHKAEVQAWMSKMEKTMQNSSVAASRQSSPHTRGDPVHTFRAPAPSNASPATASRQLASDPNLPSASPATLTSRQQSYHDQLSSQRQASQPSTPQTRYGDGQFQQPIKHAPGLNAQSSLHGVRETAGYYERTPIDGVKPRQPHQIPTQPIASNGIPVQQHYGKHQDYRGPPMRAQMSPRGQGYGQRPPQSEYSEYRTMRPHDAPGYGEQGWYPGSFDEPVYPARQ